MSFKLNQIDLQTYQLRPPPQSQQPTNNQSATQNVVMTTQQLPSSHNMDEALKKREMRLLKNRLVFTFQ